MMASLWKELYRPQFHYTPAVGWLNDPNGLVYHEGEYHLFYQHLTPEKSWGHAVSADLTHWTELPIALSPDEQGDIWSGSVVVDHANTSGFFGAGGGLVAIYTSHLPNVQSQSIAYSGDRGRTWTKSPDNPVLADAEQPDFRDPKVFWHEPARRWIMIVSVGREVRFYSSADLTSWEMESAFGQGHGVPRIMWECPDLFDLAVDGDPSRKKWVLLASCSGEPTIHPGLKRCALQYFVGEFDGHKFRNDNPPETVLMASQGLDDYAAITWGDQPRDARRIAIGWMSHWDYAAAIPTAPWQGVMTLPRVLELRTLTQGIRLCQQPVAELQGLRGAPQSWHDIHVTPGSNLLAGVAGDLLEISAEIHVEDASEFGIRVRVGSHEQTTVGYESAPSLLFLDRSQSGKTDFHPAFAQRVTAALDPGTRVVSLHLFVDRSSVEVFANDGEAYFCDLIFPSPESNGLELYTVGGSVTVRSMSITPLNSRFS